VSDLEEELRQLAGRAADQARPLAPAEVIRRGDRRRRRRVIRDGVAVLMAAGVIATGAGVLSASLDGGHPAPPSPAGRPAPSARPTPGPVTRSPEPVPSAPRPSRSVPSRPASSTPGPAASGPAASGPPAPGTQPGTVPAAGAAPPSHQPPGATAPVSPSPSHIR
jgi:hypothetical protein